MVKWSLIYLLLSMSSMLCAQSLPSWTPEELKALKKGEIIAGADILVDGYVDNTLPLIAPEPEVAPLETSESDSDYDPAIIPVEYLEKYFAHSSKHYLIDPQKLLGKQERIDREGFLDYHAKDSAIDIKIYLFDALQQIPASYSIEKLVKKRYEKTPLTAVVFYFLGDPSRNQLVFGGEGASEIDANTVRKMLESARLKAMERSEPSAQLEAFIIQLSIRLFWLEKEQAELAGQVVEAKVQEDAKAVPEPEKVVDPPVLAPKKATERHKKPHTIPEIEPSLFLKLKPYIPYICVGISGLTLSVIALLMTVILWKRGRIYRFPVFEVPCRLGADYAAGVGAVIAFHSNVGSPSSQRDQVPDYLRRI